MPYNYTQFFDKIFCINLDSRPDRWKNCILEFDNLGLTNLVERVSAFKMNPAIAGCSKSHIECIKLAKERKYSRILIVEDDITFHTDIFYKILNESHKQLLNKKIDYDILYFSANLYGNSNKLIDTNLAKITLAKAAHSYILNSKVYDLILNNYSKIDWDNEYNWQYSNKNRMNFDVWLKNIQELGNSYGVYPSIAEQKKGYSDLINMECSYNISNHYNKILKDTL